MNRKIKTDHFIYVIATVTTDDAIIGPVKIGITDNPCRRLSAIQTSCPLKIGIAIAFRFPDREVARAIESSVHNFLDDWNFIGEWFEISPSDAMRSLRIVISKSIPTYDFDASKFVMGHRP